MLQEVTVRKVEGKRDHKAFFEFPWTLYANDPKWIPPLKSIRRDTLNRDKNPSWEYLEGDYYLAQRGEQIVGTIAAFVNHRHNEFHDEHIAWFGFFETVNDPEVAGSLLNTAVEWARVRGYAAIRGPQSFTAHEECGLLIDGFEPPVILMSYNPPYYQQLIESLGFAKVQDVFSFYYNWTILHENKLAERLQRIVDRVTRSTNFRLRPLDRKNLKRDFQYFRDIYNTAWEKNWGFTPLTERELDAMVEGLGLIVDPRLGAFAVDGDEPIGFILGIPDINQALQYARPHPHIPEFITLLRLVWHWKIRSKVDKFRVPLMGVREGYRNKGVDMMLYNYFVNDVPKLLTRYQHLDSGWILETNKDMIGITKSIGMQAYRTYRFYEKSLDNETPSK